MTPETQAYVTTVIAVYGAVVATLGFVLSIVLGIHELRRERPRVRVTLDTGHLANIGKINSEPLILVEAVNTGKGDVLLENFGFLLKGGSKQVIIRPYMIELPFNLEERRRLTAYYACRWFRENKANDKIVAAFFKDVTGAMWKAKITSKMRRRTLDAPDTGYLIEWSPELMAYYPKERPTAEAE